MPLIFSYGSLQRVDVQQATYGRVLHGEADRLPGFARGLAAITDPARAAALGRTHHANVVASAGDAAGVGGMAFEITDAELVTTDAYEAADAFVRIEVTLASGRRAWVYVHAPTAPPGAR